MGTPAGRHALRDLIDSELNGWEDDVRRGRRSFAITNSGLVAERAWRNLAEYGPLTELLEDPDIWEIEINSPDQVFVKRHTGPSGYHHEAFHDDEHVIRTLTKLLDDASTSHRKLDPTEGLQDAQLDDGSRLHIVHGDLSRGGHVMVNMRRFTGVPFTRLDQLVEHGTLDPGAARFLGECVQAGLTTVFAGAPGLRQDHAPVVLRRRARPFPAGRHRRGGLRDRCASGRMWRRCRRGHLVPIGPGSTCAGWSPVSCAWPPTWPSSARSVTARRCRCC